MIGLLLRHGRTLRWLPAVAFAGLLLGIMLVSALHREASIASATRTASGVLFTLALLGGVLPFLLGRRWFEWTLPIEPRDLLRVRVLETGLLLGLPLLVAAAPLALGLRPATTHLITAAGALGLGLLASQMPLATTLRRGRPPALAQLGWLTLLASIAGVLLWLRSGDAPSAVGNWVCLVLLALGLAQAIALWQTPSVRLPIAAGRGAGERVVDTTSVQRELTRAVITGHELFTFVVPAAAVPLLVVTVFEAQLTPAMPILLLFATTGFMLRNSWRRRQQRLTGWPIPSSAGFGRLFALACLPLVGVLAPLATLADATLLASNGGRCSRYVIGSRATASFTTPPGLWKLGWGPSSDSTLTPRRTLIPGLRVRDYSRQLTGPIAEVDANYRQLLRDAITDLTGAAPTDAAVDAAMRRPHDSLVTAFPDHPWRRRWADMLVIGSVGFGLLLWSTLCAFRPQTYPRTGAGPGLGAALWPLAFLSVSVIRDVLVVAEHRAALALLHQPALAALPVFALAALTWRLFRRVRTLERQPSWLDERRGSRKPAGPSAA